MPRLCSHTLLAAARIFFAMLVSGAAVRGASAQPVDGTPCPPIVIRDSLVPGGTAAWPSVTGTQITRLNRNAVPSVCGTLKTCPGVSSITSLPLRNRVYTFTNSTDTDRCVLFTLSTACGGTLFLSAYRGAFNPSDVCLDYLADAGSSSTASSNGYTSMGVTIPAQTTIAVLVNEVLPSSACVEYTLGVQGFSCQSVRSPLILTGAAGDISSSWPSARLTSTGEGLKRGGTIEQSQCGVPKPCPGAATGTTANRRFTAIPIRSNAATTRCVNVQLNTTCAGSDAVQMVARSAFPDLVDPCAGYLADSGNSVNVAAGSASTQQSMSFLIAPGELVWLQVFEVNAGQACRAYTLTITGLSPGQPLQIGNCDGSTVPPILNAADFGCFLERFRAGVQTGN